MAASQCPKCGHLFEVRDGFGELLPLSYCSACDSYYPESLGSCKWCGTQPERPPIGPHVLKGIGIAAAVLSLGVVWLTRNTRPDDAARARTAAVRKLDSASRPIDTVESRTASASGDAVVPTAPSVPIESGVRRDVARLPDTLSVASADPIVAVAPVAPAEPTLRPEAAKAVASPTLLRTPAAKPSSSSKSRATSRWVNSISTSWVVVRADASKGSRIVASIGPGSRVQLGESRGSWRRIRARGLAGWVELHSSFVGARSPTRARGLAER
jgi:SH3 domain-containing protein